MVIDIYIFFLEISTLDFSHENKCLIHSPSDLPFPLGKQEEAEMCFLLEYETASLAKAQAGIALGLKATGRSRVSLLYIHCTLQLSALSPSHYKAEAAIRTIPFLKTFFFFTDIVLCRSDHS